MGHTMRIPHTAPDLQPNLDSRLPFVLTIGDNPDPQHIVTRPSGAANRKAYNLPLVTGAARRRIEREATGISRYDQKKRDGERKADRPFLAIDGEGFNNPLVQTATLGKHTVSFQHQRYVLMVGSNANGKAHALECWDNEIGTEQALRWIIGLPKSSILVGYALGYDYTKMLKDVPRHLLVKLYHPEWPEDKPAPPIIWWRGWGLRWLNDKLDVVRGKDRRTIWDVSKFFQSRFAEALSNWVPEAQSELAFIETMKAQRSSLTDLDNDEVKRYALTECKYLAVMMNRVRDACREAAIPLASYYGAGSIAGGLIKAHGSAQYRVNKAQSTLPPALTQAIEAAFIGGRFESAVHGPVRRTVYETDVSSAYPSAYRGLPCLMCGRWHHNDLDGAYTTALFYVRWSVPEGRWGPFPMRTPRLAYPLNGQGWIWEEEYWQAVASFPDGEFEIADVWSYRNDCDHVPHDWVEQRFAQRLAWSKEQRGIVLKLGLNAVYGKYAQRVGGRDGAYTCLAWAGLITSYTRTQLLRALVTPNAGSIIAFATDGILSLQNLGIGSKDKTLGGWESKDPMPQGAFFIANGLVIPYDGSRVRTRGYESTVITRAMPQLEAAWLSDGIDARLEVVKRQFVGAKEALKLEDQTLYGEWIDAVTTQTLDPSPARRDTYLDEGVTYSLPMLSGLNESAERASALIERSRQTLTPSLARRAIRRFEAGTRKEPITDEIRRIAASTKEQAQ